MQRREHRRELCKYRDHYRLAIGLGPDNYAYDSVYGAGNHWTGYGRLVLDHYSFQNANVVTIWLNDLGPGTWTLTTLYIKNASGYGLVASYQLRVTIDQGSLGMISENTTTISDARRPAPVG